MDPKLAMLFVLIGAIVSLSYVSERRERQRRLAARARRRFVPAWRRV